MEKASRSEIQIAWIKPEQFLIIQKLQKCLYVKPSFSHDLIPSSQLPHDCVLAGALLPHNQICIWAKPGVMHEDYIQLLENLFIDMGYVEQGFCRSIVHTARQCMQHALSIYNNHVLPVFCEYVQVASDDEF